MVGIASMFHPVSQHTRTASSWFRRLCDDAPAPVSVPVQEAGVPIHRVLRQGVVLVVGLKFRSAA